MINPWTVTLTWALDEEADRSMLSDGELHSRLVIETLMMLYKVSDITTTSPTAGV